MCGAGSIEPEACDVIVVGTSPGKTEEMTGEAFSGRSGLMLREIFDDMDLTDQAFFTNLLPRRPTAYDGTTRKPSQSECYKCSSHLWTDIVNLKPKVVVAYGQTPTTYLMAKRHRISLVHGLPIPLIRFQHRFILVPAYDFGYVSRRGGLDSETGSEWIDDLVVVKDTLGAIDG